MIKSKVDRRKPSAPSVEDMLDGGDRRSLGQVSRLVARVRRNPALLPQIIAALRSPRPLVAMRAADAVEKISRRRADSLVPYRRRLINATVRTHDPVARWNLIQCLPRLEFGRPAAMRLARRMEVWYLTDQSAIVRTSALDACVALARQEPAIEPIAERLVSKALTAPSPAVRARARRLVRA